MAAADDDTRLLTEEFNDAEVKLRSAATPDTLHNIGTAEYKVVEECLEGQPKQDGDILGDNGPPTMPIVMEEGGAESILEPNRSSGSAKGPKHTMHFLPARGSKEENPAIALRELEATQQVHQGVPGAYMETPGSSLQRVNNLRLSLVGAAEDAIQPSLLVPQTATTAMAHSSTFPGRQPDHDPSMLQQQNSNSGMDNINLVEASLVDVHYAEVVPQLPPQTTENRPVFLSTKKGRCCCCCTLCLVVVLATLTALFLVKISGPFSYPAYPKSDETYLLTFQVDSNYSTFDYDGNDVFFTDEEFCGIMKNMTTKIADNLGDDYNKTETGCYDVGATILERRPGEELQKRSWRYSFTMYYDHPLYIEVSDYNDYFFSLVLEPKTKAALEDEMSSIKTLPEDINVTITDIVIWNESLANGSFF